LTEREYRSFGLIVGGVLAFGFGLLLPFAFGNSPRLWALAAGSLLALVALLAPQALGPIYRVWMKVGHVLGTINTFILLHLIFFLIVTPFGIVLRILGRKTPFRTSAGGQSYRVRSVPQARVRMKEIF
jgi:hypothetical protein